MWMNLEMIILSEVTERHRQGTPHMWNLVFLKLIQMN